MELLNMEVECAHDLMVRLEDRLSSVLRDVDEAKSDSVPEEMLTSHADDIRRIKQGVRVLNDGIRRIITTIEL
jgi:hypothetical protein